METVNLPRGARANLDIELASSLPLNAQPEVAVSALDAYPTGVAWVAAAWVGAGVVVDGENRRTCRVLIAGPDAPAGDPAGLPIAADSLVRARVAAAPEVVPSKPIRVNLSA